MKVFIVFRFAAIIGIVIAFGLGLYVYYKLIPPDPANHRNRHNATEMRGRSQVSPPQIETIEVIHSPHAIDITIDPERYAIPVEDRAGLKGCPFCGNKYGVDFLFCTNCGLELS